jgi:hypothetical protein
MSRAGCLNDWASTAFIVEYCCGKDRFEIFVAACRPDRYINLVPSIHYRNTRRRFFKTSCSLSSFFSVPFQIERIHRAQVLPPVITHSGTERCPCRQQSVFNKKSTRPPWTPHRHGLGSRTRATADGEFPHFSSVSQHPVLKHPQSIPLRREPSFIQQV